LKFKEKLIYAFSNLSEISKKLFFYGSVIPLILLIGSIILYAFGTYTEREIAIFAIQSSFGIFAEFMLAGLIFDCIIKERDK